VVKAKGDGRADDGAAIQAAIDAAAAKGGGGLVFLPSGRYRISKTAVPVAGRTGVRRRRHAPADPAGRRDARASRRAWPTW
jgi:polygalacturonase